MNSGFVDILPFDDQGYQSDSKPLVYAFGSNKKNVKDLVDWVKIKKKEILTNLNTHGAILFRGFPVESDIDFDAFVLILQARCSVTVLPQGLCFFL